MSDPHPEQQAAPRYTYNLYVMRNGVQQQTVGGAPDAVTACTLAGAWLVAAQQMYPTKQAGIGVFDATLTQVAYIGWSPPT